MKFKRSPKRLGIPTGGLSQEKSHRKHPPGAARVAGAKTVEVELHDAGTEERGRPSFLKKRSKKLLCPLVGAAARSATANKSFLLLFFKKEELSSYVAGTTFWSMAPNSVRPSPAACATSS